MKKKLAGLLRVVVSVGILAYLFNSIFQKEAARFFEANGINPDTLSWLERTRIVWTEGPRALWQVFQRCDPIWFLLGVLCVGIVCLFGVVRWRIILRVQGIYLSFWRTTSIWFVGMFFNAFMLGSTGGDVIKAWYAARETHHKKAEAVATVMVDRIIGLLALFIIALVMMGIFYDRVFDDPRLRTFATMIVAVIIGAAIVTALSFWRGLADRFPGMAARLQRLPKYDTLRRLIDAFRAYADHPAVLVKTMLLSFGVHVAVMLSIYCVARGLAIRTENGLVDYLLYLPIINSVTAIPISISGFGVRELMYAEMFREVGMAASAAVALSLLGYIAQLVWSVVGGVFFLTHRKELPPTSEMIAEP